MKILIGHNRYQFSGGEDAVVVSESRLLSQHGQDVVFYERSNHELRKMSPWKKASAYWNIDWSKQAYEEVRSLLKKEKPSLAHFHNVYFMMSPAVYYACQDEGVPVIQSLHNFRMFCANALFFRNNMVCEDCLTKGLGEGIKHKCYKKSAIATALVTRMMEHHRIKRTWDKQINAYITATEFTKSKHVEGGILAEKIFVKPNFAEDTIYNLNGYQQYGLYVGRLSEEKGIDVLLKAYRHLPQFTLKILGEGPLSNTVKNFIKKHGLNNIEVMGFVDTENWKKLMSQARFVVIPSRCYENFPRILSESFSFGVPVVASRLGSLQELVDDQKNGFFFSAGDPQDLVNKIKQIYDHNDFLKLRQNARKTYEDKFAPEKNYQELMKIYNHVVSTQSQGAA